MNKPLGCLLAHGKDLRLDSLNLLTRVWLLTRSLNRLMACSQTQPAGASLLTLGRWHLTSSLCGLITCCVIPSQTIQAADLPLLTQAWQYSKRKRGLRS